MLEFATQPGSTLTSYTSFTTLSLSSRNCCLFSPQGFSLLVSSLPHYLPLLKKMAVQMTLVCRPLVGHLERACTPSQSAIRGFLPLAVGENSLFFFAALGNVNFSHYNNYSCIINTNIAGAMIITLSRLGCRWLTRKRSWMYRL